MEMKFTYEEFTTRNIGFVSVKEQDILKNTRVFVTGVGGMGGVALTCLARAGFEKFIIADIDHFEISNLNRQIFSFLDSIGKDKAVTAKETLEKINPNIKVELYDASWIEKIDNILQKTDIVLNGCDDVKSTILLMRKCKQHKVPAIDAFASPLPSVYVIKPDSLRPEEAFNYPSVHLPIEKITNEIENQCLQKEIEHVAIHSSSLKYVDLEIAKEMINGKRKRISFAPMVWTTGCMMAYEVVRLRLNIKGGPDVKGMFFNPWTYKIEKPKGFIKSAFRGYLVRRFIKNM